MTCSRSRRITDALRCLSFRVFLAASLLAFTPSAHATLVNGEKAIDVLGQFTSPSVDTAGDYVKGCDNNGASSIGLHLTAPTSTTGMAMDTTNYRLFVSDVANN